MIILDKTALASALKGCVEIVDDGGALRLQRMSAATRASYHGDTARVRVESPAGMVLDLLTDSATLAVDARLKPAARGYAWLDLYADGALVATAGVSDPQDRLQARFTVPAAEPGRMRRLELHLPQTKILVLERIALADGCRWTPAPPRPLLLALGDSITQGMDCRHPSLAYLMTAARLLDLDVLNQAVGGHVFAADTLPEPPAAAAAHILVAYGTNDWSQGRDPGEAGRYLAQVRRFYPDTPLTVLEPLWREQVDGAPPQVNTLGLKLEDYRQALRDLVPRLPRAGLLARETLLPAEPRLFIDGLHPNTEGHQVFGQNLAAALRRGDALRSAQHERMDA